MCLPTIFTVTSLNITKRYKFNDITNQLEPFLRRRHHLENIYIVSQSNKLVILKYWKQNRIIVRDHHYTKHIGLDSLPNRLESNGINVENVRTLNNLNKTILLIDHVWDRTSLCTVASRSLSFFVFQSWRQTATGSDRCNSFIIILFFSVSKLVNPRTIQQSHKYSIN